MRNWFVLIVCWHSERLLKTSHNTNAGSSLPRQVFWGIWIHRSTSFYILAICISQFHKYTLAMKVKIPRVNFLTHRLSTSTKNLLNMVCKNKSLCLSIFDMTAIFFSLHRSFRWCCSPANGKTFHVSGEKDCSSIINSKLCGFHHPLLVDSTLWIWHLQSYT